MKRSLLLRPALAALASALLACTFYSLNDAGAARAARQSGSQSTQGTLYAVDASGQTASVCLSGQAEAAFPVGSIA